MVNMSPVQEVSWCTAPSAGKCLMSNLSWRKSECNTHKNIYTFIYYFKKKVSTGNKKTQFTADQSMKDQSFLVLGLGAERDTK